MKPNKSIKRTKEGHTANTKVGMGDSYGSGIKNPVGRVREIIGQSNTSPKKLKKPPLSLA